MKKILFCLAVLFLSIGFTNADNIKELEDIEKLLTNTATHQEDDSTTPHTINGNDHTINGNAKKQLTIPEFNLITHLGFNKDECKKTQDEHSHHLPKGGSMYAVDIACGSEAIIVAPNYLYGDYQYTIAKVGRDKYLGDYVTIDFALPDNKVGTLVYGHTSTPLKVGDKLKAGELLGKYSPSGKTTGPHTHIELWEGGKNYTFDWKQSNNKSMRLRVQRGRASFSDSPVTVTTTIIKEAVNGTVAELATQLIQRFEGIRLKAYYDGRKGKSSCSIGHGTYANSCNEVITKEEADSRFYVALQKRIDTVEKDHPTKNNYQKAALVSLLYNCPSGYRTVTNKGVTRSNRMTCTTANGKYLRGLAKRRAAEWEFYSTPVN